MTRALFISPHLDDVVFSCGGIVALASAAGERPVVATVFASAPASVADRTKLDPIHAAWGLSGATPREVVERRRAEDRAATAMLGARSVFLGHFDAVYRDERYAARGAVFGALLEADEALARTIHAELVRLWASLGEPRVYLPLGIGDHVDHRIVAGAATALASRGAEVWRYEDFPYARKASGAGAPSSALQVVDVRQTMEARISAMAAYRSQLPALFHGEDVGDVTRAYAASTGLPDGAYGERIWRASVEPSPKRACVVVLVDLEERFNGTRPPLLEPFGAWDTLLEATLARLGASGLPSITVCCKDTVENAAVLERLRRLGVRILDADGSSIGGWIGRALDEEGASTAIVVDPRAAFTSPELVREQLALHFSEAAEVTLPSLAARGLGAVIVERSVVARLSKDEAMARSVDRALTFEGFVQRYRALYRVTHVEAAPALQSIVADLLPLEAADVRALSACAMEPLDRDYAPAIAFASARAWKRWPTIARPRPARPKILFANYTTSIRPGATRTFLDAVERWDHERYEVVVVLPGPGPLTDLLRASHRVVELNYSSVAISLEGPPGVELEELERCRKLLAEEQPALVFASNPAPILALACRIAGVPIVCHLKLCFWLSPADAREQLARQSVLPSYDLTIANSRTHAEGLLRLAQPPPGRIAWVSDGIDLDKFSRATTPKVTARRALRLPESGRIVALVGIIGPHKQTILAPDVLARLRETCPDVHIVVVGAERGVPGYQAKVEARAAELGVADRLLFLGYRKDISAVYAAADALLHLCLVESFGLVMAEAMSAELPVVAVGSGGALEIIEDGVTGRLVAPPGDPAEIARALAELFQADPGKLQAMGVAGRERAKRLFDVTSNAARLQELCDAVLNDSSAAAASKGKG